MTRSLAVIGTRGYPSYYGGFETAVRRLAPYLADQGWEVTVYGRHGATHLEDKDADPRINQVVTKGLEWKSFSTLSYGLTATMHAAMRRPDAVLVMNCANGYWLPPLKLRGIPTAVNVDGMEWERAKWGKAAKRVFKLGAKFTARSADVVIADAHEIARRWLLEFGRSSVFIPYGGDTPRQATPIPFPAKQYILVVARFVPENSIPEFFDAIEILGDEYPVVIVGSSGYGGPLDEAAQRLDSKYRNVRWLGHVADDALLHKLWQHAGAYFHGHSVGGTNPALVQAMACGAPIVARDTPYNREVLGPSGLYVHAEPQEIAATLTRRLAEVQTGHFDPEPFLERSRDEYSWQSVCRKYDAVLKNCTSRQKGTDQSALNRTGR